MERVSRILLVSTLAIMFGTTVFFIVTILINSDKPKTQQTMTDGGQLEKVTLDGHEYFIIQQYKGIGVVHNESCKCKKDL